MQLNRLKGSPVLIEAKKGAVPVEIQLLPFGPQQTVKGNWTVDAQSLEMIMADFGRRKSDPVIDYEHQSLGEGVAPAAGWIKGLINKGADGLWARVEWTKKASEYIASKEYRYLSPVFFINKTGQVAKVVNAGLTNTPLIDGMVPLASKDDLNPVLKEEGMKKELAALLGLKEDAPDDEFIQVISAKLSPQQNYPTQGEKIPGEIFGLLGLSSDAKAADVAAKIQSLQQGAEQGTVLAAKITALEDSAKKLEADRLIEAALKEGKITPAQEEWANGYATRDPEGFKVFVAKAPQVVPFEQIAAKDTTESIDREVALGRQIAAAAGASVSTK